MSPYRKRTKTKLPFLLGIALVVIAGSAAWAYGRLEQRRTPPRPVIVEIPKGSGSRQIAETLAAEGVVESPWVFLAGHLLRGRVRLPAGEYLFDRPRTALEVVDQIARGDVYQVPFRVPEGYNLFEIGTLAAEMGLSTEQEFRATARQTDLIRDLDPLAPTLEGYLFPDTYFFPRRAGATAIVRAMTRRFRAVWAELGSPQDAHRIVTLASLVEKESAIAEERPLVASVYVNRLREGMQLSCDPTTIYAALLEGRWRGTIYRSDLANPHPYNTYQHRGLPPGPIANPGKAALRSALAPADSPYLYFVAKGDGSGRHTFSRTGRDHERAVAEYRRRVR
jgi:UPF0755 protein